MRSTSRLTLVPTVHSPAVVAAIVCGISEMVNAASKTSTTVRLMPSTAMQPFSAMSSDTASGAVIVTHLALPSSRSALTVPVASMWPVSRCPPTRSPSCSARSRLTVAPVSRLASVVRCRVSGMTSAQNPPAVTAATVRQAPFTAMLSPIRRPVNGARGVISIRPSRPSHASPSVSTMPLNTFSSCPSAYTVPGDDEIRTHPLDGEVVQESRLGERRHSSATHRTHGRIAADDARRQHGHHLVDEVCVEGRSEHRRPALDEDADQPTPAEDGQERLQVDSGWRGFHDLDIDPKVPEMAEALAIRAHRGEHESPLGPVLQEACGGWDPERAVDHHTQR